MAKIVAIHQPNFFPWLGYFDKIARADIFIILDNVQFPKTGGCWSNRVKLLIGGDDRWITGPVDRSFVGTRSINQMSFLKNDIWAKKIRKTLDINYSGHPFYAETISVIEPLLMSDESNVAEYNINAITEIANLLGLGKTKLQRASELNIEGSATDLLCRAVKEVEGDVYMCGGGASTYQDDLLFEQQGIHLQYQNFLPTRYLQKSQQSFIPGLSVVDAAMNLGWAGVEALITDTKLNSAQEFPVL